MRLADRRSLHRVLLGYFLFTACEWSVWVTVLMHAFGVGGAKGAMLATLLQLLVAACAAPGGAAWLAGRPEVSALRMSFLLQGASFAAIGLSLSLGAALPVVIAIACLATAAITLTRPIHFALLARIIGRDGRLTPWNGASMILEGLAILAGPAVAGLLLAYSSATIVMVACAVVQLLAAAAIPSRQAKAGERPRVVSRLVWTQTLRGGVGALSAATSARLVIAGVAGGFFLAGAVDVLAVIFASETLRLGPGAPGTLISALGAGAVLGAAVPAVTNMAQRAVPSLLIAALMTSITFALTSVSNGLWSAALCLAAAGVGKGVLDVVSRTTLQRLLPEGDLAAAFGCQECLAHLGLACGVLAALPLVAGFGVRGAFIAAAVVLPVLCAASVLHGAPRTSQGSSLRPAQPHRETR
jgi:hypothetical protein